MKLLKLICLILLVIGGLNWGLVGIANLDVVASLFGEGTVLTKVVYDVVGLAAVLELLSMLGLIK